MRAPWKSSWNVIGTGEGEGLGEASGVGELLGLGEAEGLDAHARSVAIRMNL